MDQELLHLVGDLVKQKGDSKMINLEEKIELAKELKLKEQISLLEYRKGMFDLKFKKISMKDIRRRLTFYRFNLHKIFSIFIIIIMFLIIGRAQAIYLSWWKQLFVLFLPASVWLLESFQKTNILNCWVDNFKYEIPYGALLALKEAGEKGILHHRVFYPTWNNPWGDTLKSFSSILNDPIITGIDPRGDMVEIYSWNENDVYEN